MQKVRKIVKNSGFDSLVYVDETGFDKTNYRLSGWALKGKRIYGECRGVRVKRTSLLLAQCRHKKFSPLLFEGTCHTELFNQWLEKFLIPQLNKGQTVIMDNASFHKNSKTKELIEAHGCQLLYLPPYSPDFNPIEKTFGTLKKLRQSRGNGMELGDFICSVI